MDIITILVISATVIGFLIQLYIFWKEPEEE